MCLRLLGLAPVPIFDLSCDISFPFCRSRLVSSVCLQLEQVRVGVHSITDKTKKAAVMEKLKK